VTTTDATPRGAAGATRHDGDRTRPRLPRRPLALLLALAFFFTPLGAFVFGVRPEPLENRPLAEFPATSAGWDFIPQFTAWATDHLPLRGEAIRGNATLSERLFDEAPSYRTDPGGGPAAGVPSGESTSDDVEVEYPQVIEGRDGWLYFGGDVSNLCDATRGVDEVLDRLDRLARAVESSGRRFVVTVAPDKSSFLPDRLPETYLGRSCAEERRGEFWKAVTASPPDGYLDLRSVLEDEQDRTDAPLYRPTDSHWNDRGSAVFALELARTLDPRLVGSTTVVPTGTTSAPGDLGAMIGHPSDDEFEGVSLDRPGVAPVERDTLDLPDMPYEPETFRASTTDAPLFEQRTLLLGDSFSSASGTMLGRFFADLTLLHSEVAREKPQMAADAMVQSEVVVFEIVERTISADGGALLDDASLAAAEQTLAANPR
jgi:hypothetical protein